MIISDLNRLDAEARIIYGCVFEDPRDTDYEATAALARFDYELAKLKDRLRAMFAATGSAEHRMTP